MCDARAVKPDMNRLQRELHRLYSANYSAEIGTNLDADLEASDLISALGQVRAMVLGLARPADWAALSKVWRGVQVDLQLPAPAIAVAGPDGFQLWFSLSEPVPVRRATTFLESLRQCYLSDIQPQRVAMLPMLETASAASAPSPASAPSAASAASARHARIVPAVLAELAEPAVGGLWSAFVAADLAPLFTETPWLDLAPNPDGQAKLLASLESMPALDLLRALDQLQPAPNLDQPSSPSTEALAAAAARLPTGPAPADSERDAKRFLQSVMNDESVALALRIEAAKALLAHRDKPRRD